MQHLHWEFPLPQPPADIGGWPGWGWDHMGQWRLAHRKHQPQAWWRWESGQYYDLYSPQFCLVTLPIVCCGVSIRSSMGIFWDTPSMFYGSLLHDTFGSTHMLTSLVKVTINVCDFFFFFFFFTGGLSHKSPWCKRVLSSVMLIMNLLPPLITAISKDQYLRGH